MEKTRLAPAVLVLGLALEGVALAAICPLLISSSLDSALLSVSTDRMPKGWFNSRNAFDATKTRLETVVELGATSCSAEHTPLELDSTSDGATTADVNHAGNPLGYRYAVELDLAAWQNRWYWLQRCDGSFERRGCNESTPVTVTMTALTADGSCRTYEDDSGDEQCASDTDVLSLAAVQDPNQIETGCTESCGIGPCVSACEHDCNELLTRHARRACKSACVCDCKLALPASCPAHDECSD